MDNRPLELGQRFTYNDDEFVVLSISIRWVNGKKELIFNCQDHASIRANLDAEVAQWKAYADLQGKDDGVVK